MCGGGLSFFGSDILNHVHYKPSILIHVGVPPFLETPKSAVCGPGEQQPTLEEKKRRLKW